MSKLRTAARLASMGIRRAAAPSSVKPRLIVLEVADWCNSRCVQCNTWKNIPTPSHRLLSPADYGKALRYPHFQDVESVILTGGEVSLRHDIEQIMEEIHAALPKASIWYSTNGILPERVLEHARFALSQGIRLGVGVSVDGIGAAHDEVRGVPGNFQNADLLISKLRSMSKANPLLSIGIGYVLSPLTVKQYPAVKAYAGSMDIPLVVQALDSSGFYHTDGQSPAPADAEIRSVVESIGDHALREHWLRRLNGEMRTFSCFALSSFLFVHCDGSVSPCLRHYSRAYGNIMDSRLWRSESIKLGRAGAAACPSQCLNDWCLHASLESSLSNAIRSRSRR